MFAHISEDIYNVHINIIMLLPSSVWWGCWSVCECELARGDSGEGGRKSEDRGPFHALKGLKSTQITYVSSQNIVWRGLTEVKTYGEHTLFSYLLISD